MIRSPKSAEAELRKKKPILCNWNLLLREKYMQDPENRKIAVEYSGDNLKYIPGEYVDADLCARAILAPNSWAATAIPHDMWTEKMARIAVMRNPKIMDHVPARIKTFKWCCGMVAACPLCIKWIPDEFIKEIAVDGAKSKADPLEDLEDLWQPLGPWQRGNYGKRTEKYEALVREIIK